MSMPPADRFRLIDAWRALRARALVCLCAAIGSIAAIFSGPFVATAAAKLNASNWDLSQQKLVVKDGLMSNEGKGFNGAKPLTLAAEQTALTGLAERLEAPVVGLGKGATISVTRFDALIVNQLGLGRLAAQVQQTAAAAGLEPPSYFGTETIARFLGLRYEHPVGEQYFDLYPSQPITRAEAAHSFAIATENASWAAYYAEETFASFALPHYTTTQLEPLRIAVSKIGMPYVWGGTTDGTEDGLEHGGYDCSGFVWRVYKVAGLAAGEQIRGRTAAEQAGEIPKGQRIHLEEVQPGDLLFFGSAHFNSTATEANVIHEGLALSSEWTINSSGQGVEVQPLASGWMHESFTWARRIL
ncbi:MAG: C40 family peptidase [Solirubrobacteraceae bacterium]